MQKKKPWTSSFSRLVFALSILLAVFTLFQITNHFHLVHHDVVDYFDLVAYCAWVIIPPCWFLYEYVWLFPPESKLDATELDDLKYTHELAGKIWGGLVLLITVLLYLKYESNMLFGKPL